MAIAPYGFKFEEDSDINENLVNRIHELFEKLNEKTEYKSGFWEDYNFTFEEDYGKKQEVHISKVQQTYVERFNTVGISDDNLLDLFQFLIGAFILYEFEGYE